MNTPKGPMFVFLVMGFVVIPPLIWGQEMEQSEREAMYYRYLEFPSYVKGGSIEPHWTADGSSLWYAEGAPDETVIYKVDPKKNMKVRLFDTARLRRALTPLLGHEPPSQGLPFDKFTFVDDSEKTIKFTVEDKEFILQLDTYAIEPLPAASDAEKERFVPRVVWSDVAGHPLVWELLSPDRRWFAGVRDYNLRLRATHRDSAIQVTSDGMEDFEWNVQGARWSPDGSKLALKKVDYREVPKMPVVHWLKPTEEVEWVPISSIFSTTKAGEPLPRAELYVMDVETGQQVRVDTGEEPDQHIHIVAWRPNGSELLFLRASRTLNKVDLMGANPNTGVARLILTETQATFVAGIEIFWAFESMFSQLEDGERFIWMSERDGWNHLYLYDIDGNLIRRLTEGDFPVGEIEAVDEEGRWVYFTAHAEVARPYDTHLFRVNLEGKRFTRLTEGTGQHRIEFAPSKEYFLDTHSRVDRPPVVELRRSDGTLLQTLSRAGINGLEELGWNPPEEFVVKAADGKTDLHGVLYKPYDFDPNEKYPVIHVIYGCPHAAVVQRAFIPVEVSAKAPALAQLGFITFMVDARGTPERGKAFQDIAYRSLGRHEVPDYVATLQQLSEDRPYMDVDRVGITGHSCGGYLTIRAMLLAPEIYHVGVASAPWDPRYGNAAEVFLGLPQESEEEYEYASNLRVVDKLEGKLLIIHGTSDFSASFTATMRLIEAFIQAGKLYDLVLLPEQDHFYDDKSWAYVDNAVRRYFQEHLKP